MSTSIPIAFEIQVIPKGFDSQEHFFVTLCIVPNATVLDKFPVNLPDLLAGAGDLLLKIEGESLPIYKGPIPTASLNLLDRNLWEKLFKGVKSTTHTTVIKKSRAMQFSTISAAAALLNFAELAAKSVRSVQTLRTGISTPIRMPLMARVHLNPSTKRVNSPESLEGQLESIRDLFYRPGQSTAEVVDRIESQKNLRTTDYLDNQLANLLSGYNPQSVKDAASAVVKDPLHALGLRAKALDFLKERTAALLGMREVQSQLETLRAEEDKVAHGNVVTAWLDSLLTTAPYRKLNGGIRVPAPETGGSVHDDHDQKSIANRLAAVGQEFALHPYLGLSIDLRLKVPRAQVLKGHISASIKGLNAQSPPTAMTSDGHVEARDISKTVQPAQSGRFTANEAVMHNLEIHGNLVKLVGSLLQTLNERDPMARGAGAADLPGSTATLRTGPLTACVSGIALQRALAYSLDTDPQAAVREVSQPYYLDDFVIGMRPDLSSSRESGIYGPWLPLLERSIHYNDLDAAKLKLANDIVDETREEGFIPSLRFELPGSQTEEEPVTTFNDQLFEWSGWNPAVPIPTQLDRKASKEVHELSKTIRALPGTNPAFRYGNFVRASMRNVLCDGSSLPSPIAKCKLCELPPSPSQKEIITKGLGVGGTNVSQFRLQRFEPLRAPVSLLGPDAVASPMGELETASRVTLASKWHGGVIEHSRSTRFLVPGEIHDILELDRHGAFDHGASPQDTALVEYERTVKGEFATIQIPGQKDLQPVLRRFRTGSARPAGGHYYPDPLVHSFKLLLVRRNQAGEIRPVERDGKHCEFVHKLYPHGRVWPHALPLRIDFVAYSRDASFKPIHPTPNLFHEPCIEIGVPYGENFQVLVLPQGRPEDLLNSHAMAGLVPDDSAMLCDSLTIHVTHLLNAPYQPVLRKFEQLQRIKGLRIAPATCAIDIDAGSTQLLELVASWPEPSDNPNVGLPRLLDYGDPPRQGQMIAAVFSDQSRKAIDTSMASIGGNRLPRKGVNMPISAHESQQQEILSCSHEFPDTKHREVIYHLRAMGGNAMSKTAIGENVPPGFSESGQTYKINWPATTRPEAISVREASISMRFNRSTELLKSQSTREVAITLYMERGWDCSSGAGELAAIVCSGEMRSQWGTDPTRLTGRIASGNMSSADFGSSAQRRERGKIQLADAQKAPSTSDLVLYRPEFDVEQDAWKIDVVIKTPMDVAQPFVRLVVARFQPNALEGVMLSTPTLVDFVHLPSHRSMIVLGAYGGNPNTVRVILSGPLGEGDREGGDPQITVEVLVSETTGRGAAIWQDSGLPPSKLRSEDTPTRTALKWVANLDIKPELRRNRVGLRITERTQFVRDPFKPDAPLEFGPPSYLDIIELRLFNENEVGGPNIL